MFGYLVSPFCPFFLTSFLLVSFLVEVNPCHCAVVEFFSRFEMSLEVVHASVEAEVVLFEVVRHFVGWWKLCFSFGLRALGIPVLVSGFGCVIHDS